MSKPMDWVSGGVLGMFVTRCRRRRGRRRDGRKHECFKNAHLEEMNACP